jgi:uncharacterized protein (TIGR02145 family)
MKNQRLSLCILLLFGLGLTSIQAQHNNAQKTTSATVMDIDGNVYHQIIIGTQTWMVENLKTKRYRNGDAIDTTIPSTLDISKEIAPKYQWAYDGDEKNVSTNGRLYTWYALTDTRKVCPIGWHVSTDAEWTTLINFLGGDSIALGKLKEAGTSHWKAPNTATNESGFTALPAGNRPDDFFEGIGEWAHFWTSTESEVKKGLAYRWLVEGDYIQRDDCPKVCGWVVRCVKD